jgi:hypothetical protein
VCFLCFLSEPWAADKAAFLFWSSPQHWEPRTTCSTPSLVRLLVGLRCGRILGTASVAKDDYIEKVTC